MTKNDLPSSTVAYITLITRVFWPFLGGVIIFIKKDDHASFFMKMVITISSLKLSEIRLELITNNPKVPSKKSTRNTLNTTEKYEVITLRFWNFSKEDAIKNNLSRKINKEFVYSNVYPV